MRTVAYGAAFSRDVKASIASDWKSIDTILMGRKTWAQAVASGGGGAGGGSRGITTYVFSRTLETAPGGVHKRGRATTA